MKNSNIRRGEFQKIHEKCDGCSRIQFDEVFGYAYCNAYKNPSYWWEKGECPLCTVVKVMSKEQQGKIRVGQQKQRKN